MKNTLPERRRFTALWQRLGAKSDSQTVFSKLARYHSEPHRAYHTLTHVMQCLEELDRVRHLAEQADEIETALWFHDAVYDTQAQDNEEKSADLACDVLKSAGLSENFRTRVRMLILATKHTRPPADGDARIMTDIDISILGQPPEQFAVYEEQIRKEYDWVPADLFRQARLSVLREFSDREKIYATAYFRERYESAARKNLEQAVKLLSKGIS